MAYRELVEAIKNDYPQNATERYKKLDGFERVLNGTIYDHLAHSFDKEESGGGDYIRLRQRRPSVQYHLARIVVDETSALTFGEAHFPQIKCWDPVPLKASRADAKPKQVPAKYRATEIVAARCVEAWNLEAIMMESVFTGSVGSCGIFVRALPNGEARIDVRSGKECYPIFDIVDPQTLLGVVRIYKVDGEQLQAYGYRVDPKQIYWMRIEVGPTDERWFYPLSNEKYQRLGEIDDETGQEIRWIPDEENSGPHGFDVVPVVFVKNLRGGNGIDGPCTFEPIIDISIEIDYLLSQIGRGLVYSMDPMLVINKGELLTAGSYADTGGTPRITKSPTRALEVSKEGDAKLLEITGAGLKSGRDHVKMLREYALEVIGGMKSDQEHAGGVQSGRALELLHQALVWLVERMRVSYGNGGLVPLMRILLRGLKLGILKLPDGEPLGAYKAVNPDAPLRLVWPNWWTPRGADLFQQIQGLELLAGGSAKEPVKLLPRQVVSRIAINDLDLGDTTHILEMLDKELEQDKKDKLEQADAEAAIEEKHAPKPAPKPPGR